MPLTSDAAATINDGEIDESTEVYFLPISTHNLFSSLWGIGLFDRINHACGTLIDDYESEWLLHDQLANAGAEVNALQRQYPNGDVGEFLQQLSAQICRATETQSPLYFVC
jgi:hypothetical protein